MTLALNPKETALVLIDLQQGIMARELAPHASNDVVQRCARMADALRKAGGTVVYVHVLMNEVNRLPADRAMPRPAQPIPASASELVPEAGYQRDTDVLVAKRQWGAFTATNLDQALRRRGVKTITMGGVATNMGVESTARSAQELGYALVFAENAMSSMSTEMHNFPTNVIFPIMGHVRSTEEIVAAIGG